MSIWDGKIVAWPGEDASPTWKRRVSMPDLLPRVVGPGHQVDDPAAAVIGVAAIAAVASYKHVPDMVRAHEGTGWNVGSRKSIRLWT
jgi:hypothetical protein